MSLETCIGREHNVFHETASHAFRVLLPWPVLNYVKYQTLLGLDQRYYRNVRFSLNYEPGAWACARRLESLVESCVSAVQGGATIIVLSDRDISRDKLPDSRPTGHRRSAPGPAEGRRAAERQYYYRNRLST